MVRNSEYPTLQKIEQASESAARKQVDVGRCPGQSSEQTCDRKIMQAENNHV